VVLIIGVLLGSIIVSRIQEKKVSFEPMTQQEKPVVYSKKPEAIKDFIYENKTNVISTEKNEITTNKTDADIEENTAEEVTEIECVINAHHYSCSLDDIYYTSPVREYTSKQKKLLAKMLYCEARGESWDGQVAACSAIINHIEDNGGDFSVLDKKNHFSPASYYRDETPNQMQYDVLDYVLSGHLIADIKYFRKHHYHNFGTPMFAVGVHYFSK
jgi:hypothetical protein